MKRLLYFFFFFLFAVSPASGQVIYSEGFEYFQQNNFPPPWISTGNPGSYPWQNGVSYIIGSLCFPFISNNTRMAGVSDIVNFPAQPCGMDHNDSNVLLATPPISLSNVSNAFFRYDSWFSKKTVNGKSERATVEISTNGGVSWSVLEEAPVVSGKQTATSYISLAAYSNAPDIRIGFRYNDRGEHMTGWMIDNLQVFVPADHDLALTQALPADSMLSYVLPAANIPLGGTVVNAGSQPVTSFTVSYREGNGPLHTETVSGITIPPYQSHTFYLSAPFTVPGPGRFDMKMWVSLSGDANPSNDSAHAVIHGVSFIPDKQVVIEHGTGTWYPFAPQGYVIMKQLSQSDYPVALVALHDQDPMFTDTSYTFYVEHMRDNFIPYFFFDRRDKEEATTIVGIPASTGPTMGVYNIFNPADVYARFDRMRQYFGFANIDLSPGISGNILKLDVRVTPAMDLQGLHRLALVLTENGVQGANTGYSQVNAYSNNAVGPMDGYESLPSPVPAGSMVYDFVARKAAPAAAGAIGSLPLGMRENSQYSYTFNTPLLPGWMRKNLKATVLLIRDADSTILNSSSVALQALGIHETGAAGAFAAVYPNPADQSVNLLLALRTELSVTITVTDITGRVVLQKEAGRLGAGDHNIPLRTDSWAGGMYLVRVEAGQSRQTLKVDVIH